MRDHESRAVAAIAPRWTSATSGTDPVGPLILLAIVGSVPKICPQNTTAYCVARTVSEGSDPSPKFLIFTLAGEGKI